MGLGLSMVLGAALFMAPGQDAIGFPGVWVRDVDRSDDPQQKMQEAMQQMREQGGGRGRGGGGGRPDGGGMPGGGPGGRGGRAQAGGGGRPDIGGVADELTLELADDELHVDDGERLRIYYLDGEEHAREMANGTKLETVAELKGNAVYIEETMERSELARKYELAPDGGTMVLTTTVQFDRMKDPVVIKTVYERASASSQ